MLFSIIIPSYNQPEFISYTLDSICKLKEVAAEFGAGIEVLLFDNESEEAVQAVIQRYAYVIDYLEVKKDNGQYDAINKGLKRIRGNYWTWLNTDDIIDPEGFRKTITILKAYPQIDYIYGAIRYINEKGEHLKDISTWELTIPDMVSKQPAVFQPGSFFKTAFTSKIGYLEAYRCCFDYEYILRCLKNKAVFHVNSHIVALFRYHSRSKTGSSTLYFVREQLEISRNYGRKWYHFLTFFLYLRLLKHSLS